MDPTDKTHLRVSADFIRQQPEYKQIIMSRQTLGPRCPRDQICQRSEEVQGNFHKDFARSREAFHQTLLDHKSKNFGNPPDLEVTSSSRRPTTNHNSTSGDKKVMPSSNGQSNSSNVILKNDEDMGLKISSLKRRRYSWHNSFPATLEKRGNHIPSNSRSHSKTVLFCHKINTNKIRPKTAIAPQTLLEKVDSESVNTKDPTGQGKGYKNGLSQNLKGTGGVDMKCGRTKNIQSVYRLDNGQVQRPTKFDETENRNLSEEFAIAVGKKASEFGDVDDFHHTVDVITVVSSIDDTTNVNVPDMKPSEQNGLDQDCTHSSPGNQHTSSSCDDLPKASGEGRNEELRESRIHFADTSTNISEGKCEDVQLKPPMSASAMKRSQPGHAQAQGENGASGYDAKLEKSAVYLRSQNRTFTRASQYMSPGTSRRGLSVVNVHYSQTNTGFNDRIIFTDLLKAAHTTNALIGDNVYTMERRLYNRRSDPTRCTTFYDRFNDGDQSRKIRRRTKSAAGLLQKASTETGIKLPSSRTVAGKMKARKERIQKKKERMEMGYVPRMTSLEIPNSKDIEDLLMSCRYLRIQPDKQPWLYETEGLEYLDDVDKEIQPVACNVDQVAG